MMFNDERRTLLLMLLVALIVLASPVVIKWALNQDTYLSEETYYNVRMTEQIKDQGIQTQDALQQRSYDFSLFHYLAAKSRISISALAKYLPVLLGILTLFLVYLLLKRLNAGQNDNFFTIILLATTPIFLFEFTTFSPEILVFPLLLLGLVLFFRNDSWSYLSAPLFGAAAFLNIMYPLIALVLVAWDYFTRRKKHILSAACVLLMLGSVAVGAFILGINYLTAFVPAKIGLNGFLIEFGAVKGYALAMLGLSLIGLFSWWGRHRARTPALAGALVLFLFSFFFASSRLPVALLLAGFAAFSISYLANREWEIQQLKNITLLLILCILIFSAVLLLNYQVKNIDPQETAAIVYLSPGAKPGGATPDSGGAVLSAERNGFLIEYVAGRKAYLDDDSYMFSDYSQRRQTADRIYYARNMAELESLLKTAGISYILVDDAMRSGEIWNGRYEGLLFFLENSDRFVKVFYDDKIQIYRYAPEGDVPA
jgi:hypothetical protein